jgi:hypothetical protein
VRWGEEEGKVCAQLLLVVLPQECSNLRTLLLRSGLGLQVLEMEADVALAEAGARGELDVREVHLEDLVEGRRCDGQIAQILARLLQQIPAAHGYRHVVLIEVWHDVSVRGHNGLHVCDDSGSVESRN